MGFGTVSATLLHEIENPCAALKRDRALSVTEGIKEKKRRSKRKEVG